MIRLSLLTAVLLAGLVAASCGSSVEWVQCAMNGGDIEVWGVHIAVDNQYPAPGEEIAVRGTTAVTALSLDGTSSQLEPEPPSAFTYTATAGQFRPPNGELNDPGAVHAGRQIEADELVYWRAPLEPGIVTLAASAYGETDSIKVIVQDRQGATR